MDNNSLDIQKKNLVVVLEFTHSYWIQMHTTVFRFVFVKNVEKTFFIFLQNHKSTPHRVVLWHILQINPEISFSLFSLYAHRKCSNDIFCFLSFHLLLCQCLYTSCTQLSSFQVSPVYVWVLKPPGTRFRKALSTRGQAMLLCAWTDATLPAWNGSLSVHYNMTANQAYVCAKVVLQLRLIYCGMWSTAGPKGHWLLPYFLFTRGVLRDLEFMLQYIYRTAYGINEDKRQTEHHASLCCLEFYKLSLTVRYN